MPELQSPSKEKAARYAGPLARSGTHLSPAKKRGASQLDLAGHTLRGPLRDSDKGSPNAPRFLASVRQRRRGLETLMTDKRS